MSNCIDTVNIICDKSVNNSWYGEDSCDNGNNCDCEDMILNTRFVSVEGDSCPIYNTSITYEPTLDDDDGEKGTPSLSTGAIIGIILAVIIFILIIVFVIYYRKKVNKATSTANAISKTVQAGQVVSSTGDKQEPMYSPQDVQMQPVNAVASSTAASEPLVPQSTNDPPSSHAVVNNVNNDVVNGDGGASTMQ